MAATIARLGKTMDIRITGCGRGSRRPILMELTGTLLQYEEVPEALEYRQSPSRTQRL
ncbi:hypothetical protein [Actinoplanes teichomyceticus]|uniref:Uncharacterized protein n=1 Tax=Actinoplanes teichomyceticus TaxID=1867 RepID=A0A561VJ34_ACTTI|nr:hypothetical protein [Actinoplanes teichomyceticus]TWG11646.1 hypothetical protein FHX34_106376 [Actinoplanes teichomyceticus]GIF15484.1 hypothetical protein Ate01nite_55160 [Actinoplanes teichomyceticus]